MDRDSPLLGITLMLGFCILAPLADATAKLIGAAIPLGQLVLVRFAIQALILWPLFRRGGHRLSLPPRLFGRILWRTLLQVAGIATMVFALRHLPLADAIAIAYVMPFFMLLLGRFVLQEQVGSRRLVACIVGFAGTLMVVQPAFAQLGWVALLPLLVAVEFALFILVTRQISREIAPIPLQAITGLLGTALLFPVILLAEGSGIAELDPVEPTLREGLLLVALGILGTLSHLLMTWALRFAPAATLAPMQYLEIPFGALFGWLIFAQFPNGLALAGICVVMLSGLYIIWRERMASRAPAR
ncbi:DMT family transporter [Aliiruegeria lutimaris]|nr:DMT family transporter [Aliiruegeria lutimaris]